MTTPFDDPRTELAWTFLQFLCQGGDADECFALLSDDFTYWSIITRDSIDKATLRREVARRAGRIEMTLDLVRCLNDGGTVVVEAHGDAVNADGVRYESPYLFLFETRDGLISSVREYCDTRSAAEVLC